MGNGQLAISNRQSADRSRQTADHLVFFLFGFLYLRACGLASGGRRILVAWFFYLIFDAWFLVLILHPASGIQHPASVLPELYRSHRLHFSNDQGRDEECKKTHDKGARIYHT